MRIALWGGPGDGAVIDVLNPDRIAFEWMNGGGRAVYKRRAHCGHADCPVPFVYVRTEQPAPPAGPVR